MKTWNFIFLIAALVNVFVFGNETRKVVKRNLVSKFTSNPFFLRHFTDNSGGYYYGYESYQPARDSGYYAAVNTWIDEDEEEEPETDVTEDTRVFRDQLDDEGEDYFFNTLPHYEHGIFSTGDRKPKVIVATTEEPQNQTEDSGVEVFIFRSVPYYDRVIVFKNVEEHTDLLIEDEDQTEEAVTTQPQPVVQQDKQRNNTEVYVFSSLPHFQRSLSFQAKNVTTQPPPVDQDDKPQQQLNRSEIYVFNSLPHYQKSLSFQTKDVTTPPPVVQDEKPQQLNRSETYVFNSLPHYQTSLLFKTKNVSQILTTQQQLVLQEDKPQQLNKSEIYIFSSLPHYQRSLLFKTQEQKLENDNSTLPHIDVRQNSAEPVLFVSKLAEQHAEGETFSFSSLPHYSTVNFQPKSHRKVVRVVRKKKKLSDDGSESKVVLESIANLPLEAPGGVTSTFDSYGIALGSSQQ